VHGAYGPDSGDYKVLDCNEHFVSLQHVASSKTVTEPISRIELKMDDEKGQLMLLFSAYY